MLSQNVYLVFDRYRECSIKSDTRMERLGEFRRAHHLLPGSPLPSKDVVMKVTKTKVQLISLIVYFLLDHFIASENKLVITSANDCPEQSQKDVVVRSTRCSCVVSRCKTAACSCSSAGLQCSHFCGCQEQGCENKWNQDEEDINDE